LVIWHSYGECMAKRLTSVGNHNAHLLVVWQSICTWTPSFYRHAHCNGCMLLQ